MKKSFTQSILKVHYQGNANTRETDMLLNGYPTVAGTFEDPTLQLAADELSALCRRRFPRPAEWEAVFAIDKKLPSFEVHFSAPTLTIAGPSAVEILYGVYDFAEKILGFFFYEPGNDLLTASAPVEISDGIVIPARKVPFKVRGFIQEYPFNQDSLLLADWMAKNKLNFLNVWMKYYDKLDAAGREAFRVRGIEIQSGHHNFDYWIPAAKYYREHPEFFAEINGTRIKPEKDENSLLLGKQLCTTNKELRREIVSNMVDYIEKNPELKSVGLTPNDGFGWCECPECSKFYDKSKHGELYSLSSHVYIADRIFHDMIRDVANQLGRRRPDINLYFCAYINYSRPSEGFKLTPNLAVMMAPYWRCVNHRIDEKCPINSHYADDIKAWCDSKAGGKVVIYEYYMGVNFYLSLPLIFHHTIFQECAYYESIGVDGIATQFHPPHWTAYGLNFIAMAKALRGEKEEDAIPRIMNSLFGSDAAEAEAFYSYLRSITSSAGPCHITYPYALFSRTELAPYAEALNLAKRLLSKDPASKLRRELVIWAEYLYRYKSLFDAFHAGTAGIPEIDELLEWIHLHRNTHIFVHNRFDTFFEAWRSAIRQKKEYLHFNLDWEDEYIRKHRIVLNTPEQ